MSVTKSPNRGEKPSYSAIVILVLSFALMMWCIIAGSGMGLKDFVQLLGDLKFMGLLFLDSRVMVIELLFFPLAMVSILPHLASIYGLVRWDAWARWRKHDLSNWARPSNGRPVNARALLDELKRGLWRHCLLAAVIFYVTAMFYHSVEHWSMPSTVLWFVAMMSFGVWGWISCMRWLGRVDRLESMGLVSVFNCDNRMQNGKQ